MYTFNLFLSLVFIIDHIFNRELIKLVTINTNCYGYWITEVIENGEIIRSNCFRAYPRWMNDLHEKIEHFRFRNLFIPGTHDSCSYAEDFNSISMETIVTKYSLTQDDTIRNQLLHGIRYLDIRVGYYKMLNTRFWGNHGISRQQTLDSIFKQVREFVLQTNEIVILDIQEFPVGFGKDLKVHRKLVQFIEREIGDLIVSGTLSWHHSLKEIWDSQRNIIVAYDHVAVVNEFPEKLWVSAEQRWGNVQKLESLQRHLEIVNEQTRK